MVVKGLNNMGEYLAAVSTEGRLVIIDCYADWCGPCRAISPKVEGFSVQAENENVDFYKVNVDDVPDVAQELGVRAMPTFYFFKGGNKVGEVVGANPRAIETAISEHR